MSATPTSSDQLGEVKAHFLASLNHEIRTPLTGILGMLDLLLETGLTEEQLEYAESSRTCAENLLELMNSTLEYSALSANQIVLEEAEFPLRQLLDSMLDEFALKVKTKGLSLIRSFDENLPESVLGDALRLKQLLVNLVENAVKFTERGEVEVATSSIVLEDGDVLLTVLVRDTGIGMPAEKLDLIFESFRQLESGIARRFGGMGLGLALTQELAKLMRADITVTSELGLGSTFAVNIPLRLPREARAKLRNGRSLFRILMIEDQAAFSQNLEIQVLHRRSYRLDVAASAEEALELAGENGYDLILIDLQAPEINGLQLSRELRSLRGYADIPMLALTANCTLDSFDLVKQQGMQGFLPKPVQSSELLLTLQKFLPIDTPDATAPRANGFAV